MQSRSSLLYSQVLTYLSQGELVQSSWTCVTDPGEVVAVLLESTVQLDIPDLGEAVAVLLESTVQLDIPDLGEAVAVLLESTVQLDIPDLGEAVSVLLVTVLLQSIQSSWTYLSQVKKICCCLACVYSQAGHT